MGLTRATLLRAAGQICFREQLWGKSKSYLLESLAADAHPLTLLALARLAEAIGDAGEAAEYFRKAALGLATFSTGSLGVAGSLWPGQRDTRTTLSRLA